MNRLIVVGQIAFSLVLLVSAGLFLRTLQNLRDVDAGFEREGVLQFSIENSGPTGGWDGFLELLFGRLETLPGVVSAAHYGRQGLFGSINTATLEVAGYVPSPGEVLNASVLRIGPGFFETMDISLLAGRDFQPADLQSEEQAQSVVISENMTRHLWASKIRSAEGSRSERTSS